MGAAARRKWYEAAAATIWKCKKLKGSRIQLMSLMPQLSTLVGIKRKTERPARTAAAAAAVARRRWCEAAAAIIWKCKKLKGSRTQPMYLMPQLSTLVGIKRKTERPA